MDYSLRILESTVQDPCLFLIVPTLRQNFSVTVKCMCVAASNLLFDSLCFFFFSLPTPSSPVHSYLSLIKLFLPFLSPSFSSPSNPFSSLPSFFFPPLLFLFSSFSSLLSLLLLPSPRSFSPPPVPSPPSHPFSPLIPDGHEPSLFVRGRPVCVQGCYHLLRS